MKRLFAASLALLPLAAQADVLGFTVGANAWQQNISGEVSTDKSLYTYDIESDLGYDDNNGTTVYVAFEHFIPLIPNFRLESTDIDASVDVADAPINTYTPPSVFAPILDPLESTIDFSHVNATAYYEILDNWVSLDLGVSVSYYENGVDLDTTLSNNSLEIDEYVPMLYGAVKFELPLSGLYAGANTNYHDYDDLQIIDYSVNLGYETDLGLGVELGYRSYNVEQSSRREYIDITVEGAYAGLYFAF